MREPDEKTGELYRSVGDPLTIAAMLGFDDLYPWQAQTLMDVFAPWGRVAIVTPNESGKTSRLVLLAGLCWMLRYPGSKVVSTAGVFRQVSDQLWPNVKEVAGRFSDWKVNDEKLTIPSPCGIRPSEWTIFATNDANKAEGYHNQTIFDGAGRSVFAPLLFIIDEAKGVDDAIFFARDRCNPYSALEASTPGPDKGVFYERIMKHRGSKERGRFKWVVHEIGWHDCPHLLEGGNYEMRRNMISDWGEQHPVVQSMIHGKFYSEENAKIFIISYVDECMSGRVARWGRSRRCAVDLGFGGADETTYGLREGNATIKLEAFHEADNSRQLLRLCRMFEADRLRPSEITIDASGPGGKLAADELEARGWRGLNRYMNGAKPQDARLYASLGTEYHYKLARLVKRLFVILPRNAKLREQMRRRRFTMLPSGVLRIESKEVMRLRGEASPNELDCIAMLYADMEEPQGMVSGEGISEYEKWLSMTSDESVVAGYAGMNLDC